MEKLVGGRYKAVPEAQLPGFGGMYQAIDSQTGRTVEVEVLHRLTNEAADELRQYGGCTPAGLDDPNIVRVHDVVVDEDQALVITEAIEGRPLSEMLAEGPISLLQLRSVICDAAHVVGSAHAQGAVHGYLTPSVLWVTADNGVKVRWSLPAAGRPASGGRLYAAPEVADGSPADARSDVYSLGVILYQGATGIVASASAGNDAVGIAFRSFLEDEVPPSDVTAQVPSDWDLVILKAIAIDPARRYQTLTELEHDLAALPVPEAALAKPDRGPKSESKPARYTVDPEAASPVVPAAREKAPPSQDVRAARGEPLYIARSPGPSKGKLPALPESVRGDALNGFALASVTGALSREEVHPRQRAVPLEHSDYDQEDAVRFRRFGPAARVAAPVLVLLMLAMVGLFVFHTMLGSPTKQVLNPVAPSQLRVAGARDGGTFVSGRSITMRWSKIAGASNYRLLVTRVAVTRDGGQTSAAQSVEVLPLTNAYHFRMRGPADYGWKVQAAVQGVWWPYSARESFSVRIPPLATPLLQLPAPGAVLKPGAIKFCWGAVKGAQSYYFRFAGGSPIGVPGICLSLPLHFGTYRWTVAARQGSRRGAFSVSRQLYIPAPALTHLIPIRKHVSPTAVPQIPVAQNPVISQQPAQPVVPVRQQPVVPVRQQPVVPVRQQPVISVQQQPVVPAQQQPVVPARQQPVVPVQQQPPVVRPPAQTQPVVQRPVQQPVTRPVSPPSRPVAQATAASLPAPQVHPVAPQAPPVAAPTSAAAPCVAGITCP